MRETTTAAAAAVEFQLFMTVGWREGTEVQYKNIKRTGPYLRSYFPTHMTFDLNIVSFGLQCIIAIRAHALHIDIQYM